MNRILIAAGMISGLALASPAETYYALESASSADLASLTCCTNASGANPSSPLGVDDTLVLCDKTYEVPCGSPAFDAISAMGRLVPRRHTRLVLTDESADDNHELRCAYSSGADADAYKNGELVKKGPGTLTLGSSGRVLRSGNANGWYDYYSAVTVCDGSVRGLHSDSSSAVTVSLGVLSVSNGASFVMFGSSNKGWTTAVSGLNGGGCVTNDLATSQNFHPYALSMDEAGWFTGSLAGKILFTGSGPVNLAGSNSTFTSSMQTKLLAGNESRRVEDGWGVVGVGRFGESGKPSSIGTSKIVYTYTSGQNCGGGYRYLGTEEDVTDKDFKFRSVSGNGLQSQPAVMDAGEGRVVFTGSFQGFDAYPMALYLRAGSAGRARMDGPVYDWSANGVVTTPATAARYPLHIRKIDPGVWEFSGGATNSTNSGAWTIDEGTVRFASVGHVGEISALGTATNLLSFAVGNAATRIAAAVTLGGTNRANAPTEGTLEYIGTADCVTTNRSVALAGNGRLTASGTGGLGWRGISGAGAGARTLTLGGAAQSGYSVSDVSDGANAPVSLVKTNAGVWCVAAPLGFTGGLDVKEGALEVATAYTWFRFTVKKNKGNTQVQFGKLALFDAEGAQQNIGLEVVSSLEGKANIRLTPGQAAFCDSNYAYTAADRTLDVLFRDPAADKWLFGLSHKINKGDKTATTPSPDDPSSWVRFVMRLADGAKPVVGYDIRSYNGQDRELDSWMLEGSVDGVTWDVLDEQKNFTGTATTKSHWWYGAGGTAIVQTKCFPVSGQGPGSAEHDFGAMPVSVASGATLKASGAVTVGNLAVDIRGAGTFNQISFAETGSLNLIGSFKGSSVEIPATFSDCPGLDNLKGWTVTMDGRPVRMDIHVTESGLTVVRKPGLILLFK